MSLEKNSGVKREINLICVSVAKLGAIFFVNYQIKVYDV